jgi:hypothetical protein
MMNQFRNHATLRCSEDEEIPGEGDFDCDEVEEVVPAREFFEVI